MQGILYVSHGTRYDKGKQEAIEFLTDIQPSVDAPLQQICFLEISEPDVQEGVRKLIDAGATSISVVPILLLTAGHALKDIPIELKKVKEIYPWLELTYGEPLGVQERIIDVAVDRIEEASSLTDDTTILLVGRGSYDPATKRDIEYIAQSVEGRLHVRVETAYLAAIEPKFNDIIEEWPRSSRLVVVPYLWFDGLLIQSMEKKVSSLQQDGVEISLCRPLGDHTNMKRALIDRVNESFDFPFVVVEAKD
ncbi:cobalamin biosynthesis protein CbiX [Halobacillus andaensis]|uniref:Cobalamin biosynthesis protein CbiX n=1 Tax=Halobacillus andaensis TaxID=1176239 RepID=A0A917EWC8_HALAA|nr:sirohydrochlorin chelatase [Halobacillus andaensis]MBP2005792.1 sirohydrochlorin ferrochelatase [Halobacillus andaensis]GGF26036.1 cobalamin biosynthesis protein CbiX [Halobacillus andaensis]